MRKIVALMAVGTGLVVMLAVMRCSVEPAVEFTGTGQLKAFVELRTDLHCALDNERGHVGNIVISRKPMTADEATKAIARPDGDKFVHIFDQPESFKGIAYAVKVVPGSSLRYEDGTHSRRFGNVWIVGDKEIIDQIEAALRP